MTILNNLKKLLILSISLCFVSSLYAQLDPQQKPGANFDLSEWKLNYPMENATQEDLGDFSNAYFYTNTASGGMVFKCPNIVDETGGSSYPRCELRELLNKGASASAKSNNWTLSTNSTKDDYGGYNGVLFATLSVDHVSTTYDSDYQVGRVIVGQIHGDDNEPCRIYYRLLPGHEKGSIYFAHEQSKVWGDDKQEFWHELIGTRSTSGSEPENGIALGEIWSYMINVQEESMTVSIYDAERTEIASKTISSSMSGSDNFDATYANSDNYLYFKAGVYNQNNGGETSDYAQATFYQLFNTHSPDPDSIPLPIPPPSSISVSPSSLNFLSEGGSETVYITSSTDWTSSTSDSWITLSTESGSGNGSLSINIEENAENTVRSGSVSITDKDNFSTTVSISQAVKTPEGQVELTISSATASIENTSKGEVAANVLDNDVTTIWAGDGTNGDPTLDLELSTQYMVSAIEIGFSKQDTRETYFSVQYWDNAQYVDLLMDQTQGVVDGNDATSLFTFYFPMAVPTNNIRILGHGNSNSEWNSYTEVNLYGWECTDCQTAIDDKLIEDEICLYPNPSEGSFVLENCSGSHLNIYSISGTVVFAQDITSNHERITTNLPNGVYISSISNGKQSPISSRLFIK